MNINLTVYDMKNFLDKYTKFMTKDIYISNKMYLKFLEQYSYLFKKLEEDKTFFNDNKEYKKMIEIFTNKIGLLKLHNQKYLKRALKVYHLFFDGLLLEDKLDIKSRMMILTEEDSTYIAEYKNYESLIVGKVKYLIDHQKYLSDNILVLSVNSDTLDNRKKIVKELNKFKVIKCDKLKPNELNKFIKDYCKNNNYKINEDAVNLMIERLNDNLYIISSELDKMFLYKDDNVITKDDVFLVTSRVINTNIFDLINAIVEKNIDKALFVYDDLLLINEEEIKLIVTLANQFRLIYQVKSMFKSGYSELDISKSLGVHPYRIKLASGVNISMDDVLKILRRLALLDENIKTGKVDKKEAFLKFILSL